MKIRLWLKKHELGAVYKAFVDAGITDTSDLKELTEDDWKEIGADAGWKIVMRRKVLNAVAEFKKGRPGASKPKAKPAPVKKPKPAPVKKPKPSPRAKKPVRTQKVDVTKERAPPKRASPKKRAMPKKADLQRKLKAPQVIVVDDLGELPRARPQRSRNRSAGVSSQAQKYRDSIMAALPRNLQLRKSVFSAGSALLPQSTAFIGDEFEEIPTELPPLNSVPEILEAIKNNMFTCDNPQLDAPPQDAISEEVSHLQNKIDAELFEKLTEEQDLNIKKMRQQVEDIIDFSEEVGESRAYLEKNLLLLKKLRPPRDNKLIRESERHRQILEQYKEFAEEYLGAKTELESLKTKLGKIDNKTFAEMKAMKRPPKVLEDVITAVLLCFGLKPDKDPKKTWRAATSFICKSDLKDKLINFDPKSLKGADRKRAYTFITDREESFDEERVFNVNRKAVVLAEWLNGLANLFEVFAKLEQFPDGENILNQIEEAYVQLKINKAEIKRLEHVQNCWQNVIEQCEFDIQLLQQIETCLDRITSRREKMIHKLEEFKKLPKIPDTILPENYLLPYENACKKIKTRFGELTEVEFQFVFLMIKRFFVRLIRFYKTYAGFEGKTSSGLEGMSSLIFGVCCKACKFPMDDEDDSQEFISEIFKLAAAQTMESNRHSVEFATQRMTKREVDEMKEDLGSDLTGIWKCGESTTGLWTLETKLGGGFTGFIGNEKSASIDGKHMDDNDMEFTITYHLKKQVYKCKAHMDDDGQSIRVKYITPKKKRGYWVLNKTGAKVRAKAVGVTTLTYDSFIEGIIRLSIFLWPDEPAWEAIEKMMEEHVIKYGLADWDIVPETNETVAKYFSDKPQKSILTALFGKFSQTRKDKKKGRLLTYIKWEELCKKISRAAGTSPVPYEQPSFRTQQFAFFTSKEMFPQDGSLKELNWGEFQMAVCRLGYKMVLDKKPRGMPKEVLTRPKLSTQVQGMMLWLKECKK